MDWSIWITGPPGSATAAIARAVAAELRSHGERVVALDLERVRAAVAGEPGVAAGETLAGVLVYVAAVLTDAQVPVIVDGGAVAARGVALARAGLPRFAEVCLGWPPTEEEKDRREPPELILNGATSVPQAAADIIAFIHRRFLPVRRPPLEREHGEAGLRRRLLEAEALPGGSEIQRRARVLAARLLGEAGVAAPLPLAPPSEARDRMVDVQIAARGVADPAVLDAMRQVPREAFVPEHLVPFAYEDEPLPIGEGQTISQPYVVAAMTEAARLSRRDRVLEIGTGSGYAAAVLGTIAAEVYTVERLPALARLAAHRLAELGYANVHVREGDGSLGWREHAPYDAIIVTAGGPDVPRSLLAQLAVGGRLVMPVGRTPRFQRLVRVVRTAEGRYDRDDLEEVAFVPLIGAEGWPPDEAEVLHG